MTDLLLESVEKSGGDTGETFNCLGNALHRLAPAAVLPEDNFMA